MPKVGDCVAAQKVCEVEDEVLFLPSDFTEDERQKYGLHLLAVEEMKLREGQAHDSLRDLRAAIKYGRTLNQHRRNHVRKQGPVTRARAIIHDARLKQTAQEEKYRAARKAMLDLGRTDKTFPELKPEDTYTKDTMVPHTLGDGSTTEGWIWRVGPMGKMSDAELEDWTKESEWWLRGCPSNFTFIPCITVDRVQWFRAYADMWRWQEEVETLEAEFRRTTRSFERMAIVWKALAEKHSQRGYAAYAHEKSSMYRKMAEVCRAKYKAAGGTWPEPGVSLSDHIRQNRPEMRR